MQGWQTTSWYVKIRCKQNCNQILAAIRNSDSLIMSSIKQCKYCGAECDKDHNCLDVERNACNGRPPPKFKFVNQLDFISPLNFVLSSFSVTWKDKCCVWRGPVEPYMYTNGKWARTGIRIRIYTGGTHRRMTTRMDTAQSANRYSNLARLRWSTTEDATIKVGT